MTIKLYNTTDSNIKVNKKLTHLKDLTGTLREDCSIMDPVITIQESWGDDMKDLNYLQIPTFERYYYITDIEVISNKLFRLHCHVDVLMSHKSELLKKDAVISRQEKQYNLYLNDGSLKAYQNPVVTAKSFPSGFSNDGTFVLAVSGS